MQKSEKIIDIIIPVYNAREATLTCLHSVLDSRSCLRSSVEVIVVYDAGPDDGLRDELLEMAAQKQIVLLINDQNMGFVRSVNRGMAHNPDRDVILLNSDTRVAGDWVDRLHASAGSAEDIGTVTPFSNNAEICSWPLLCRDNALPEPYDTNAVDSAFASLGPVQVEIPTAVGFCMYIRRQCLLDIGLFNVSIFGHGYGEENDFCMRAARAGYRHLLAGNVFVFHQGGASFGEEKEARLKKAIEILDRLYPHYLPQVSQHIAEDPAGLWRFAAELALLRQSSLPLVLHISHGIGGGTDKHVVELCQHSRSEVQHAMLVPQAESMRLVFPNVISGGLFEFPDKAADELCHLLITLGLARVHVHHVKGWESRLDKLLRLLDVPFEITLHDYYYIHPNPALADTQGRFCEDPQTRDQLSSEAVSLPAGFQISQWRQQWRSFLGQAQRIIAPSQAAISIYREYYPELEIQHAFHPDWQQKAPYPPTIMRSLSPEEPFRIAVLGALSIIKGANVLERTSVLAARLQPDMHFSLVGYAYKNLNPAIDTTGPYTDQQLPDLLARIKPHLIWFPCTWPETYSYTLSYALEAGIPVLCPNLGAFPERLQNRPASWLLDWKSSPEQILETLTELRSQFRSEPLTREWLQQPAADFDYRRDYVAELRQSAAVQAAATDWNSLMARWLKELPQRETMNRRIFRILVWLHCHPLFGSVAEMIPMKLRRSIKRKLSTRPLHE